MRFFAIFSVGVLPHGRNVMTTAPAVTSVFKEERKGECSPLLFTSLVCPVMKTTKNPSTSFLEYLPFIFLGQCRVTWRF